MKKSVLLWMTVLFAAGMVSDVAASPSVILPIDTVNAEEIGVGSLTTVSGNGSFFDYNVADTMLDVLMIKMDIITWGASFDAPGLGAIQLFNGASQVQGEYAAANVQDWLYNQQPNIWYSAASSGSYGISNPVFNGNVNDMGGVNDNYTARLHYSDPIDTLYYYVGFDNPVFITDIKLSNGINRTGIQYYLTFYAYPGIASETIPEPATVVLMGMAIMGCIRRMKR